MSQVRHGAMTLILGLKALKVRADDYLEKPYGAEELKRKIQIHCQEKAI